MKKTIKSSEVVAILGQYGIFYALCDKLNTSPQQSYTVADVLKLDDVSPSIKAEVVFLFIEYANEAVGLAVVCANIFALKSGNSTAKMAYRQMLDNVLEGADCTGYELSRRAIDECIRDSNCAPALEALIASHYYAFVTKIDEAKALERAAARAQTAVLEAARFLQKTANDDAFLSVLTSYLKRFDD